MAMTENEQTFIAQKRQEPNSRKRKMQIGGRGGSTAARLCHHHYRQPVVVAVPGALVSLRCFVVCSS